MSRGERGAVTAELAMALPLLLAVTAGLAWLLALGVDQVRVVDAARETARAVARGDDPAVAVAVGQRVAPEGARIEVAGRDGQVVVTASTRVAAPGGPLFDWAGVTIEAEAVALAETSG